MSVSIPIVSKSTLEGAIEDLIDVLLEEEVCDIVNERAQECFFGKEEEEITEVKVDPDLESVNAPNLDIFGQVLGKKAAFEIQCPNCKRTLAAVRFAPHLEKCMGMGRNSSRIASRRLAASAAGNNNSNAFSSALDVQRSSSPGPSNGSTTTVNQTNNGDIASEDDHFEDVDDDEDWTMEKKRRGKRTVEKTTSRRKGNNGRSRRHADAKARPVSPSVSASFSPSSSSIDPGDEASNFSTTSSH